MYNVYFNFFKSIFLHLRHLILFCLLFHFYFRLLIRFLMSGINIRSLNSRYLFLLFRMVAAALRFLFIVILTLNIIERVIFFWPVGRILMQWAIGQLVGYKRILIFCLITKALHFFILILHTTQVRYWVALSDLFVRHCIDFCDHRLEKHLNSIRIFCSCFEILNLLIILLDQFLILV